MQLTEKEREVLDVAPKDWEPLPTEADTSYWVVGCLAKRKLIEIRIDLRLHQIWEWRRAEKNHEHC